MKKWVRYFGQFHIKAEEAGISQTELRRLRRSGIKVSPLGLGTALLAGLGWREDITPQVTPESKREAIQGIQVAFDLGTTLFDTADDYDDRLSEDVLGEALRGRHGVKDNPSMEGTSVPIIMRYLPIDFRQNIKYNHFKRQKLE